MSRGGNSDWPLVLPKGMGSFDCVRLALTSLRMTRNGAAGVPAPHPCGNGRKHRPPPTWGLCARQNYPILEIAADPDGGLVGAPRIDVGDSPRRRFPLLFSTMKRLTARFLLLVLFAGTLAPFAAASAPMQHEHCARKPLADRTESTPPCHHHAAADPSHESAVSGPSSNDTIRSNSCCTGHECCRSMARSQWAQVGPRTILQQSGRAADRVAFLQEQVRSLDLPAYHSVRAPPIL